MMMLCHLLSYYYYMLIDNDEDNDDNDNNNNIHRIPRSIGCFCITSIYIFQHSHVQSCQSRVNHRMIIGTQHQKLILLLV